MRTKQRIGDKIITTIESPAVIEYADIIAKAKVEQDDLNEAPWEHCDGWQHHLANASKMRFYGLNGNDVIQSGDYRRQIIVVDYPIDVWLWRKHGASRQTIAEMTACAKRRFISQLRNWYENGWEWFVASVCYRTPDGDRYQASCGMIDDADYAERDVIPDLVGEVIHDLEKDGYTVSGKPTPQDGLATQREAKRKRLRYNVNCQNWHE